MNPTPTELEQLSLLALMRAGPDADGAAVREVITERAGRSVSLGSLYNTLMRMEERGWVESAMGEPTPERGGKARRLYRVTERGHEALVVARKVFERMWAGLPEAPAP